MSVLKIIIGLVVILGLLAVMTRLFGRRSSRQSALGCLGVMAVLFVTAVLVGSTAALVYLRRAAEAARPAQTPGKSTCAAKQTP